MYHKLLLDASFWAFLFEIDQELAEAQRAELCPACGGRLDCANYPRKPRGPRNLPKQYRYRLSFCCDRDGCRKRVTPPSVRFLGRKVYLGAIVILVSAMPGVRFRGQGDGCAAEARGTSPVPVEWRRGLPR